jgi:hypothetical protein
MDFLDDLISPQPAAPAPVRPADVLDMLPAVEERLVATIDDDGDFLGRKPVSDSADLRRIEALPRRRQVAISKREKNPMLEPLRARLHGKLALPGCDRELKDLQVWALSELPVVGGGLVFAGVGHGKTLTSVLLPMVFPKCQHAVLLIPASARASFAKEWADEWKRWRLPNLAGGKEFVANRPLLTVITYPELSQPSSSELLERLQPVPDLFLLDEAHRLKDLKASSTKRVRRFRHGHLECRFVFLTGTPSGRSVREYGHLAHWSLGDGSPVPISYPALEEWAGALDAPDKRSLQTPPGHLRRLCVGLEGVREGFRRRLVETPGVIATTEGSADSGLSIHERPIKVPPVVRSLLVSMRGEDEEEGKGGTWERPDGEEMITAPQVAESAKEIAAGFYLRWRYLRGEPLELREKWFARRKAWRAELREQLKRGGPQMDSEFLVTSAAVRYWDGYSYKDGNGQEHQVPPGGRGPMPTWAAEHFLPWREIEHEVEHVEEEVWVDDFLARDAAAWAKEAPGIVWVHNNALGARIAALAGVPYYAGGKKASLSLVNERGERSVVASISAHGEIKNLQVFTRNLFAQLPSSGKIYEQAIGRTYRQGQDEPVEVFIYAHTREYREAFEQGVRDAKYAEQTRGTHQLLVHASYGFDWWQYNT